MILLQFLTVWFSLGIVSVYLYCYVNAHDISEVDYADNANINFLMIPFLFSPLVLMYLLPAATIKVIYSHCKRIKYPKPKVEKESLYVSIAKKASGKL